MTIRFLKSASTRVTKGVMAIAMAALSIFPGACHSKPKPAEEVPPIGYFATRAEAQAAANQANADLVRSREVHKAAGVPEQDLPCGQYKAVSRNDSDGHTWWRTERDMTVCPGPALAPLSQPQSRGGQPQ